MGTDFSRCTMTRKRLSWMEILRLIIQMGGTTTYPYHPAQMACQLRKPLGTHRNTGEAKRTRKINRWKKLKRNRIA